MLSIIPNKERAYGNIQGSYKVVYFQPNKKKRNPRKGDLTL